MAEVMMFPEWRQNSTPAEKLAEMAQFAELRPAAVNNLIVIYEDVDGIRQMAVDGKITLEKTVYLLERVKLDLMKDT
jgi:hypothetical protein